jgi:phospholipid/cholesterol/gamma-HCH transport system substrate-binding protein
VNRIIANVDNVSQSLSENRQVISDAVKDAGSLMRRLNDSAPKLDAALSDVSNLAKAFDPAKVGRTVDNVDRFAQALGDRSQDVDKAIAEARSLAEKLNKSADRVDNVLKAAENFLGSASGKEGESTFGEIREAARSIRTLADNLDKRTAEITTGINRFTGSGLREYEQLASDGRRTVNDIGRAVRNLERNPQQLIFGGQPTLPQYNGRR